MTRFVPVHPEIIPEPDPDIESIQNPEVRKLVQDYCNLMAQSGLPDAPVQQGIWFNICKDILRIAMKNGKGNFLTGMFDEMPVTEKQEK